MTDDLYREYEAAIGSVMNARLQYDDACSAHGAESWAAEQARDYLDREIGHRDHVRERYDTDARGHVERTHSALKTWKR